MIRRKVKVAVLSDLHLGTYGCHAKEVYNYLKSIEPETLILNGDVIDIWAFKKSYFPKVHFLVVEELMKMATAGKAFYYLTGNHDDLLRRFSGMQLGNFHLEDKLVLTIDGKKHWFFHGDIFDFSTQHSKWLAKLGGKGYDLLIRLNRAVNWILTKMGRPKMSFSNKIKQSVKTAVKFISNFETTAAELAIENRYDYVVCGHIHHAQIRNVSTPNGRTTYMNSGDWVESLTALEYTNDKWSIYKYDDHYFGKEGAFNLDTEVDWIDKNPDEMISGFVKEHLTKSREKSDDLVRYLESQE